MKCASYAESFYKTVIPYTEKREADTLITTGLKTLGNLAARAGSATLSLSEMGIVSSMRAPGLPVSWLLGKEFVLINEHVLSAKDIFAASLMGEDSDFSQKMDTSQKLGYGIFAIATLASLYFLSSEELSIRNTLFLGGIFATWLYFYSGRREQNATTSKATTNVEAEEEVSIPNFAHQKRSRRKDVRFIFPDTQSKTAPVLPYEPSIDTLQKQASSLILKGEEESNIPPMPPRAPTPPLTHLFPTATMTTPLQPPSPRDLTRQIGKLKPLTNQIPKPKPSFLASTMGKVFGEAFKKKFANTFSKTDEEEASDWSD